MYSRRHFLLYYYKYKDSPYFSLSIFLLLILVAFLLLMKVVLPQIYSWFSINNEVVATRQRIATIDANIAYVNSLNGDDLVKKRTIFVRALPYDKDIQGILTTISSSAADSGTGLDDFSLSIGELSPKNVQSSLSSLRLTLNANGSPSTIHKFITNLQTRLPLVEVTGIALTSDNAEIEIVVYYKTLPIFKVNDSDPIQRISGKFNDIYTILSQWSVNTDAGINAPEAISPTPAKP